MFIGELLGIVLVGYGIWFSSEGVKRCFSTSKDWWRPTKGKRRQAYPASAALLGLCFVVAGLRAALNSVWAHAQILLYVAGGMFVVVLVIGIAQPRFLHPRWYGALQDRFGIKGVARLKEAALQLDDEEWSEVSASDADFENWANRAIPQQARKQGRGYKKSSDGE